MAFLLFFAVLATNNTNIQAETLETESIQNVDVETLETKSIKLETNSTNKIQIWFNGVVIGAFSAGTFIYLTGKAPEETEK